jgi:predicted esterase YcpF (UPF0227 family)
MKPVLYFHGFASSPASAKITALRPLLEPRGIELITPDLNVPSFAKLDFDAVVEHAVAEARRVSPVAMVGSSMGSLIALAVAQRGMAVPMVLIAPALGVARRWKQKIPDGDPINVFNHALGLEAPIHRAFFLQMADVHVDETPPPSRVTVIMGQYDETVPHHIAQETWNSWRLGPPSHFFTVEDGDHGLVGFSDLIAEAIVDAAAEATR